MTSQLDRILANQEASAVHYGDADRIALWRERAAQSEEAAA